MKESFKQKMQENKPHLTFKNTKKNICLEKKREFFFTLTPSVCVCVCVWTDAALAHEGQAGAVLTLCGKIRIE